MEGSVQSRGRAPRRAPRREGRRTTLRVPAALEPAVEATAAALGVSHNEALVHLATLGAEVEERRREVARLAEERRRAVFSVGGRTVDISEFPSEEEMHEAVMSAREAG